MQLVFIPGNGNYEMGLSNTLDVEIVFTLKLVLNQETFLRDTNVIHAGAYYKVTTLYSGFINDQPRIQLEYQANFTNGLGSKFQLEKKLRPKQFIRGLQALAGDRRSGVIIQLMDKLPATSADDQLKIVRTEYPDLVEESSAIDLTRHAQYSMVKDLHAEALGLQGLKLNSGELLSRQLSEFDNWLDWGIRFKQSPLFVIHGMGKGKLKQELHDKLKYHQDIQSFKNEFHPQFGFGATEITLID